MTNPTFKTPQAAFNDAIKQDRMNIESAKLYLYMGTKDGIDVFQNANTGESLDKLQPTRFYNYGWPMPS